MGETRNTEKDGFGQDVRGENKIKTLRVIDGLGDVKQKKEGGGGASNDGKKHTVGN